MAIRKIRLGGEQLGRIQKKHVERAFDEKSIPEPKIDNVELPLIPIVAEERSKFINHNFGRFPDVQVTDSNGNIIGVDIKHIDDNNIYISWSGSIVGTIIIN